MKDEMTGNKNHDDNGEIDEDNNNVDNEIWNEEKPATYPTHGVPWQISGRRQTQEPSPSKNILNIFCISDYNI